MGKEFSGGLTPNPHVKRLYFYPLTHEYQLEQTLRRVNSKNQAGDLLNPEHGLLESTADVTPRRITRNGKKHSPSEDGKKVEGRGS